MKLITLFLAFFPWQALANTYVICGETVDRDTLTVSGYELELSSESDDYTGPVGINWNLKLESEASEWLKPNRHVVARNFQDASKTVVEIEVASGKSISGFVGVAYKLIGLYDEEPILEKYTMGGFAGTVKIGTFACASGND